MSEKKKGADPKTIRARICCLKCGDLMAIRYCDLWAPHDPDSKVKCDKCGEWSTLAELNLTQPEDPRAHEAIRLYIRQTAQRCAEIVEASVPDDSRVALRQAENAAAEIRREFGI